MVKNLPANARDAGDPDSNPGSGRSPGVGSGNLVLSSIIQYYPVLSISVHPRLHMCFDRIKLSILGILKRKEKVNLMLILALF